MPAPVWASCFASVLHGEDSLLPPCPHHPSANKGEPNPGPDTTAADAAGAAGSGSGSPAEAPAGSEEADQAAEGNAAAQRLLYRAELVTLLYDKLAEQSVPAGQVPEKLGAKPKASTVGWVVRWGRWCRQCGMSMLYGHVCGGVEGVWSGTA